jgi:hypothetical protein
MRRKEILIRGIFVGAKKGVFAYLWLLKILLPVSFITHLLVVFDVIESLDFLLAPLMGLLSLPAAASVPLITGLLTGIYGAVAGMAVVPLTSGEMTRIAVFVLISHNLLQEALIQSKAGLHPVKAVLYRLIASFATVWVLTLFFPAAVGPAEAPVQKTAAASLLASVKAWGISTFYLCIKIFIVILVVLVVMEWMKRFRIIEQVVGLISPLLAVAGVTRRVGMLWLTGVLFGLSYGAAVIVEASREETLTADELERLHMSIGIHHAVIEDPAVFLPLGIPPVFLWLPRFLAAVTATHLHRGISRYRRGKHNAGR